MVANRGKTEETRGEGGGGGGSVGMPLRPPQTSQLNLLALNLRFHVEKLAFDRL